jgi:HEAT repeat protein
MKRTLAVLAALSCLAQMPSARADELTAAKRQDVLRLLDLTGAFRIGQIFGSAIVRQMNDALRSARPDIPSDVMDILPKAVDEVIAWLVAALDDELAAPGAERSLRKLGSAFAPKLRELGSALKTEAGQARLNALVGAKSASQRSGEAAHDGPLANLSGLAPAEAAELIGLTLGHRDVQQRRAAAQSLDENNALLVRRAHLHSRISDTDALVRRLVIRALGLIEDVSAVPLLGARLRRPIQAEERISIYTALTEMHAPQAQVLLLEGALNEADVAVRVTCIEGLANYPSPRVVKALEGLASRLLVHPKVQNAASKALERLDEGQVR